ncbi:hypothetical protein Dimus_039540 [Dionaea muscipula]
MVSRSMTSSDDDEEDADENVEERDDDDEEEEDEEEEGGGEGGGGGGLLSLRRFVEEKDEVDDVDDEESEENEDRESDEETHKEKKRKKCDDDDDDDDDDDGGPVKDIPKDEEQIEISSVSSSPAGSTSRKKVHCGASSTSFDDYEDPALMMRVQQLLGTWSSITTCPNPVSTQHEEPPSVADLKEAITQFKSFLTLSHNDALSPLGEVKLNTANTLAKKAYKALGVSLTIKSLAQNLVRDIGLLVDKIRQLNSKRSSNSAILSHQLELETKGKTKQLGVKGLAKELVTEESVLSGLQSELRALQRLISETMQQITTKRCNLAREAKELEQLAADLREARQIDCLAVKRELDEEDERLQTEWARLQKLAKDVDAQL